MFIFFIVAEVEGVRIWREDCDLQLQAIILP